jgi:hypothetical protein
MTNPMENAMSRIFIRSGDGWVTALSEADLQKELEDGTRQAAAQGGIDSLTAEELDHLMDICNPIKK